MTTSCEELTHGKRLWFWEGLGAGGEGDDRGWDGWMASLTRWMWVWVNLGVGDGQGGLVCCNSWGCKESDTTEWLKWTKQSRRGNLKYMGECEQVISKYYFVCFCSVTKSCTTLCDPMGCRIQAPLSSTVRICSNSCSLSHWDCLTISSSVALFSSCL